VKTTAPHAALLSALALTAAGAVGAAAQPAPKPQLIVAISVDQLSADLFAEYRQLFPATGGLGRLSREGVVFPSGYQGHAATETCPGHSTLLTGARPARTGIIANSWYDLGAPREDKLIYCAEDESVAGSSSKSYTVSAVHLKVPTLGERMKAADPATRSVAVAGKDRAAVMMAGRVVDQVWWWDGKVFTGPAGQAASAAVTAVNNLVTGRVTVARAALEVPAACAARDRAVSIGGGRSVGTHRFLRQAGDTRAFRASPEFDWAVLTLAAAFVRELQLGRGPATDILNVGLSATDSVGHTYGTEGVEMCLQMFELDRELGVFFHRLDISGVDYAVVLSADHGGHDLPERHREHAAPTAERIDPGLTAKALGKKIAAERKLKIAGPLLYADGPFGDVWVDPALTGRKREKVVARAKALYLAHRQVAAVFTRAEIQAVKPPAGPPDTWSLAERVRASFHPGRSGDLVVLLKPWVTPIAEAGAGYVATHGSPWDYDRRVPILFWRKGITPFEQPLAVETVDIAPTLAALIGLPIPAGEIDGRCLDLDAGAGSTCN
jgi:predicted AlkP superfamily pyrophosphatase or phosphodiesterase